MNTDRSRILAAQSCPRSRYLAYHIHGTGIQKKAKSLPLQFGSAFHIGSEILLNGPDISGRSIEETSKLWGKSVIEVAVEKARQFLADEFAAHQIGFDGEPSEDIQRAMEYGQEEQMALAEGLLRAWWIYEGESFLENFEIIEVEKEGRVNLTNEPHEWRDLGNKEKQCIHCGAIECSSAGERSCMRSLVLMFRPDALVRDKQSGDYYIISWKTCSTFTQRTINQARVDMQSMSEVFGVEQNRGIKVEGVIYRFVVKGQRRLDNYDKLYKQGSHLAYGWKKLGKPGDEGVEWSWTFAWPKEDDSGESRLGKGWQKVPIWRDYPGGVKQWIEDLSNNQIFPRHIDALANVFPQSLPVERRKDEVESWKRQVIAQETEIEKRVTLMADSEKWAIKENLDELFPQHTHSCWSYSGCPFIPVCWEGIAPEPGELYQIRTQNHPEKELED